jgi:hypothetical protein
LIAQATLPVRVVHNTRVVSGDAALSTPTQTAVGRMLPLQLFKLPVVQVVSVVLCHEDITQHNAHYQTVQIVEPNARPILHLQCTYNTLQGD